MARLNSFYLNKKNWQSPYQLDEDESKHFIKVLRGKKGEVIRLFDGYGKEGLFKVQDISKKRVLLEPLSITQHPEPENKIKVALAWQRAKNRDFILEKCVELKCWEIIFWPAKYSPPFTQEIKESWLKKIINAGKQCQNPWLPQIKILNSLEELTNSNSEYQKLFFWEKEEKNLLTKISLEKNILIVIGPEGGFAEQESTYLKQKGFTSVSLGSSTLRLETAMLIGIGYIYLFLESST
ncbi:MAG: rRNA (uracil1498-N3)-methyltransferase [Desulfonauticus sp.]|nr:rRNA (uracil1498-N3)-methyltransferase [Desulfonauticus sp.]